MKKGLLGFILVFLFVFPLASTLEMRAGALKENAFFERKVLSLEKKYYLDLEVKESLKQVFESAVGTSREERVQDVAQKLVSWEAFLEKHFREQGIFFDAWFGSINGAEADELARRVMKEKKVSKCSNCFDFDSEAIGWDKKIVFKSAGFLDWDPLQGTRISRNGFSFVPELADLYGEIAFGATAFIPEENLSFVVLIPEGFG
jgi:hypothetical protein